MKKNKMMRLASSLLVAVLLTSSVISGTFAKYVTEGSAGDTARVARFGVAVTATGDLFNHTYKNVAGNNVFGTDTDTDEAVLTVVSELGGSVVAPGTKNEGLTLAVTGQPEVDVNVKTDFTMSLTGWSVTDDTFYCPIIITVENRNGSKVVLDGLEYNTADLFIEAVTNAVVAGASNVDGTVYHVNTDLTTEASLAKTITWEWPFVAEGTRTQTDVKDTELGNHAAGTDSIVINWKVTVTQVD